MRRWTKRILIVLAVFVLPVVAFYLYARWQGERELRAAIAELDAAGEPWRFEELYANAPKLADKDDARAFFREVREQAPFGILARKIFEQALDRPSNAIIPPDLAQEYHEAMQELAAGIEKARKLADMPNARLRVEWPANSAWPSFNDTQQAREFINLLHHAAAWHAQQGDLDAAMEYCLAMQRTAQSIQEEPTLIAQLVRIAIQAIALHSLERVVAQGRPSAKQLERVQAAWEQFDGLRALQHGFIGERAGNHRMFAGLESGDQFLSNYAPSRKGVASIRDSAVDWFSLMHMRLTLKQAHAWTLRHWTEVIRSLDLPEEQRMARQAELEKEAPHAPGAAKMLIPAWLKVSQAQLRSEAQTRCAIVGLAAERFRIDNQRWPKSLDELCPKYLAKVPADPYAAQPLGLRQAPDGIVIYSVGPDGKEAGDYQDKTARQRYAIRFEFRLWNVAERRKLILGKSE